MSEPNIESVVTEFHRRGLRATFHLEPMGKLYHFAQKVSPTGRVSALCYRRPHAIPNSERWTLTATAVNCPKCLRLLKK